ncbi:MAG: phosphatase PAP2 family protein [Acutalibacteraceae bacterium]|nr:phosphatase PAP2 family protein [Acutalibacteraceae bacterium]
MAELFDVFLNFDLSVFEWIQSIQTGILNTIMVVITTLGDEGIFFIALGIVLMCFKKHRKAGMAVLVALLVMEVGNNLVLKELIARPRPFFIFNPDAIPLDHKNYAEIFEKVTASVERLPELAARWVDTYRFPNLVHAPSSWSFPSGHTSSAFAAAFAVLWYNRKIGIPTVVFAALMGFSRIYVQVHYCTDVIAGTLVAVVYALIAVLIMKYLFPVADKYVFSKIEEAVKNKKAKKA